MVIFLSFAAIRDEGGFEQFVIFIVLFLPALIALVIGSFYVADGHRNKHRAPGVICCATGDCQHLSKFSADLTWGRVLLREDELVWQSGSFIQRKTNHYKPLDQITDVIYVPLRYPFPLTAVVISVNGKTDDVLLVRFPKCLVAELKRYKG